MEWKSSCTFVAYPPLSGATTRYPFRFSCDVCSYSGKRQKEKMAPIDLPTDKASKEAYLMY
jgi:hypothetical protein